MKIRTQIDIVLDELCEIYEKRTPSLEKYWMIALDQYSDEQIIKALKGYYERNKNPFFPTPAEFIQYKYQAPIM